MSFSGIPSYPYEFEYGSDTPVPDSMDVESVASLEELPEEALWEPLTEESPEESASQSIHLTEAPRIQLRHKPGAVQTFIYAKAKSGGNHQVRSYEEFQRKHGSAAEKIYQEIETCLDKEGFTVLTVWPRSGKIDLLNKATGEKTFLILDTKNNQHQPWIQGLRELFAKEKWKTDTWCSISPHERGDQNGPEPLLKNSERLQKLTFNDALKKKALETIPKPEEQIATLRKLHWTDAFSDWMQKHTQGKIQNLSQDPSQAHLKAQYEKLQKRLAAADAFAVKSALSFTDRGERRKLLAQHIQSIPGPVSKGIVNRLKPERYKQTDDALVKSEEEYIQDILSLDVLRRADYHASVAVPKKDCFEQLQLQLIDCIEQGKSIEDLLLHPLIDQYTVGLPASEQIAFKQAIRDFIEEAGKEKDALQPEQFDAKASPADLIRSFDRVVGKAKPADLSQLLQKA